MAGVLISPMFKPVYGQLGTTFGGNHLVCSAALAVLDVIEQETDRECSPSRQLPDNGTKEIPSNQGRSRTRTHDRAGI